jgi:hypothetical protein
MKEIKQHRPDWIEPNVLKELGFNLISDEDGYLKYGCDGKTFICGAYNKEYPLPKHKRLIYVNCTYAPTENVVFVGITEDGDTRTCYNGVCGSLDFFKQLIYNTR